MLGNFKLAQKGLLFISIPLLLQLSLLAMYGQLLAQTDFLTQKEHREKNVIGRANWVSTLVLAYLMCAYVESYESIEQLDSIIDYCISASRTNLKELEDAVGNSDHQLKILAEAKQTNEELIAYLGQERKTHSKAKDANTKLDIKKEVLPRLQKLFAMRSSLLGAESARYKIGSESVASIRAKKRDFITYAAAISILIAAIVFWVFTREITARLLVLAKNNELFAKRKDLIPALPGKDEVAQLDKSFHEMAHLIREGELRKQEYMQMISHDMRTPLTSVMCSLELLAIPEFNLTADGQRQLIKAETELSRVLAMINEILEMERIESGAFSLHREIVDVEQIVAPAVQLVQPLASEAGVEIVVENSPQIEIFVDTDKAIRVMTNLVANAVKFSPAQSTIKIVWSKSSETRVKVVVQDQGRGIPPEFINSVFERFKQVDAADSKQHKGSGLGLAICQAIIEAHGGKIGVESTVGIGSKFWFELDIEDDE